MSAHWKTRRLAARVKKVVLRHADKPAIAAFQLTLVPKADDFIASYDEAARHEAEWRRDMVEGRDSLGNLQLEVDSWKPHVVRERPGFDATTIGDRPTVPEDLIQDAHAIADELDLVREADGTTVKPWAAAAAASLRSKAEIAERETDEAAAADATRNEQLTAVREKKVSLDAELTLFRSSLRAVLGRSHPDFQKLRAEKAAALDEEDDPEAPQPSRPVIPAPTEPQPVS
jgi:hypothetical protein